jgi:formate/nitrite transporter FocA (FNT family)
MPIETRKSNLTHPLLIAIAAIGIALVPLMSRWFLAVRIPFPILAGGLIGGAIIANYFYWRAYRRNKQG